MTRTVTLLAQLAGVIALAALAMGLGVPPAPVVVLAATVGGALVVRHGAERRDTGARERHGDLATDWSVTVPADRTAVGPTFQIRFLPPARAVWAPGLLCAAPGRIGFLPSKDRHADRSWSGAVDRVEIKALPTQASVVRVHGPDGSAQFMVQQPGAALREAFGPYVAVSGG